jgi:acetyltransferase
MQAMDFDAVRQREHVMKMKSITEQFETKAGTLIWIRPLLPEDTPYLVDLFEHMGADSRYSRFHQPLDSITPERIWEEAENIAHTPMQVGFIAFADLPDQPEVAVGAVRYVCLGDGVAEAAVSVRDDMQGQGIGTQLMSLLAAEAKNQGMIRLTANIQSANKAIIRVLNRLPYPHTRTTLGPDSEVALDLTSFKSNH